MRLLGDSFVHGPNFQQGAVKKHKASQAELDALVQTLESM